MNFEIILYVCYATLQSIFFSIVATKPAERDNYIVMFFMYVVLAPLLTLGFLIFAIFKLFKWMLASYK